METFSEQDRHRRVLALILCLFLGVLYYESIWRPYFHPAAVKPKAPATSVPATSGVATAGQLSESTTDSASGAQVDSAPPAVQATAEGGVPSDSELAASGIIAIEGRDLSVELTLLGGRVRAARLNKYFLDQEHLGQKLDLVRHVEQAPLPLGVYSGNESDLLTHYRIVSPPSLSTSDQAQTQRIALANDPVEVVLEGTLDDGRAITKKFRFYPEGYLFDVEVALAASEQAPRAALEWTQYFEQTDTSMLDPYNVKGFTWFDGEKAQRLKFADLTEPQQDLSRVNWAAVVEKYFAAAIIAKDQTRTGELRKDRNVLAARLHGSSDAIALSVFVGPKSYSMLEDLGFELQRLLDFGWTGFVAGPLLSLLHAVYGLIGNYGLAIVVLTILVRLALYPLNVAQFKQMKVMQDLKPEIDRIKERVDDKQEQQRLLMELYTKKGANPLGGCLPLVLQMPIFIGLYSALILAVELRGADFALWITDLSAPEKLMVGGIGIPVMVILFVISMIGQQLTTPTAMDPTQKKVMMVMPIVFGFMFAKFPAGLTLYWLTSNLISIGQQKALHNERVSGKHALMITVGVSAAVFTLAFIITLF